MEHVGRQADHGEVVNNENGSEVDRLPVLHQAGAEPDHTEVQQEDECHGDRGVDQEPRVRPLVCIMSELCVRELQGIIYEMLQNLNDLSEARRVVHPYIHSERFLRESYTKIPHFERICLHLSRKYHSIEEWHGGKSCDSACQKTSHKAAIVDARQGKHLHPTRPSKHTHICSIA